MHLHSSQRRVKHYCDFVDIAYQKLISRSVTRWLSLYPSLPRMLQLYPASHSYFMSIDKPTVVLKRFFWKFFERCNENHGQCKRYQRHIANVTITPVIVISALQINNRSYRNVCNMLLISFSLAVLFITRLFSTSAFRVPKFVERFCTH